MTGYLNASPSQGDIISVYDKSSIFTTNNFTIDGNGNTINGYSSVALNVDDTIATVIFENDEWKMDIGGFSTVTPSGSINFSAISETTQMTSDDRFIMLDDFDGQNKKITLTN